MIELPDDPTIEAARRRIADHVRVTPVIGPGAGSFGSAADLRLKLELLQHTGSFKPRGAFNTVLSTAVPAAGLVAASGGNHGQAVAYVGRALGLRTEIFVPGVTPALKRDRIVGYGATVTVVGEMYDDAQEAADRRAAETGALLVHPFDLPDVVAGQATVGAELLDQVPDVETVVVAVGGGGLLAGVASAVRDRARIVAVEPAACPSLHASLAAGGRVRVEVSGVAADSLGSRLVGAHAFEAARRWVDEVVLVDDADIVATQRELWAELRLIAEPGGATSLAALRAGAVAVAAGERVVVVVCGANTDPQTVTGS